MAVTPGIPRVEETPRDSGLIGILTFVKIEIIFITSIHKGPASKPNKAERTGCSDFIILRIATSIRKTPPHIAKIIHNGIKSIPSYTLLQCMRGCLFLCNKDYIGTALFLS